MAYDKNSTRDLELMDKYNIFQINLDQVENFCHKPLDFCDYFVLAPLTPNV